MNLFVDSSVMMSSHRN